MKLSSSLLPIALSALILSPSIAISEDLYPDSYLISQLEAVQQQLFNDQFKQAQASCRQLIKSSPADPAGYVFKAATMIAEMTDREENLYGQQFLTLLDTIDILSKQRMTAASERLTGWCYLWIGHAEAYRALYESRFGSFYNAVRSGFRAKTAYQTGLDIDPANYDLLLGLGSYHYWKSAKAGPLSWIGIFKNQKDLGIDELELAADSASLFAAEARRTLIWIWLNEKKFDSVIAITEEILLAFPDGKAVSWPLAEAYQKSGELEKAIMIYQKLRDGLISDPGNYFNLIESEYRLAKLYKKLSQKKLLTETASHLKNFIEFIPSDVKKRQKSKLRFLSRQGG